MAEVAREVEHAAHHLFGHEVSGFVDVVAEVGRLCLRTCIEGADETAGSLAVALVDDGHGHVADDLVVVDPRVEQWVGYGDEYEEDEHAFVGDGGAHFLGPDIAHVFEAVDDFL